MVLPLQNFQSDHSAFICSSHSKRNKKFSLSFALYITAHHFERFFLCYFVEIFLCFSKMKVSAQ